MQNIGKAGAVPNINDEDLFPTFEAAEKIEKLKKDDEKKRLFCIEFWSFDACHCFWVLFCSG